MHTQTQFFVGWGTLSLINAGLAQAKLAVSEGLLVPQEFANGKAVLTFQGRLLADGLVARLWA